jgi:hypothetical protein
MRKTAIKTAGWAFITTAIFVLSGMLTGLDFSTAFGASILGTAIKTPVYSVYETLMGYIL